MNYYQNRVALRPTQKPIIFESARAMESVDLEFRLPSSNERLENVGQPQFDFSLFKQNEQATHDWEIVRQNEPQKKEARDSKRTPTSLTSNYQNQIDQLPKEFKDKEIQVNIEESLRLINQSKSREMFQPNDLIMMQKHLTACQNIINQQVNQNQWPQKNPSSKNEIFNYSDSSSNSILPQLPILIPQQLVYPSNSPLKIKTRHKAADSSSSSSYSQLHGNQSQRSKSPINATTKPIPTERNQINWDLQKLNNRFNHINTSSENEIVPIYKQHQPHKRVNTEPQHNNIRIQKSKPQSMQVPNKIIPQATTKILNKQPSYSTTKKRVVNTPQKQTVSTTKKKSLNLTQNFDDGQTSHAQQPQYIMLDFTKKAHQSNTSFQQYPKMTLASHEKVDVQYLEPYIKVDMTLDDLLKNYDQNEIY